MEFQIMDRLNFQRFLGLSLSDDVPDAKAIWYYRNELTKAGVIKKLFARFYKELEKKHDEDHTVESDRETARRRESYRPSILWWYLRRD